MERISQNKKLLMLDLFILILSTMAMKESSAFFHNHKKRKNTLETRAVLLMFSLELIISRVVVQSIYQNSEK